MKEITYKELEKIVQKQPAAFLCGNGFSINFDSDFANIYDRLYEAHKLLIQSGKYDVKANNSFNKIFKDNYKSVCKYVYTYKQKNIEQIFMSGVCFAESIIKDVELIEKLNSNGYIHKLVFGKTEFDLVESIASVGNKHGYRAVNIEYWSILIYMFFAINSLNNEKYEFPKNNEFITLIKVGNINKNKLVPETDDIHQLRNITRFPEDFMFQLTTEEDGFLKSQFATSNWGGKRKLPYAFTEQGIYMLATVLRGGG